MDTTPDKKSSDKDQHILLPTPTTHNGQVLSETEYLVRNQAELSRSYGKPGIRSFLRSPVVVLSAWAAAMCGFLYGYDQGLINVTLVINQFLQKYPEVDASASSRAAFYKGLVTAIFELGAVLGALQSAFFCDRFSRRYTILVACAWYLVGGAIQAGSQSYTMLVFGRLIGGVGVGGASMIAPLYISEIAPPNIRGALLTLQQWMLILGIVAAYYTTYGSRHIHGNWSWQTAFVAQLVPGLILAGIVAFLPFSPRWLIMRGRTDEALATLAKLRRLPTDDARVRAEWAIMRCETLIQKRQVGEDEGQVVRGVVPFIQNEWKRWRLCFTSRYIRRIHISMGLNVFQQWVGVNGFTYYSNSLFEQLGYGYEERLMLGGLLSVVQLVGSTVPLFTIDHVGRRPLLLVGTFLMMACHAITGATIGVSYKNWPSHQSNAKAGTAFMFIFMFTFENCWGPIAWGLPAEILPSTIRAEGMALAAASNWLSNFVVGLIVPAIVQAAPYASFALFACTSFLALVWVFCFVPETKGKTLEALSETLNEDADSFETSEREDVIASVLRSFPQASVA